MAIVSELTGRRISAEKGRRKYLVEDVTDEVTAYSLIQALSPIVWRGLVRQSFHVEERGGGIWDAVVPYGIRQRKEAGSTPAFNFELATTKLHITNAIEHIESYPIGSAPDHQGAIGVKRDAGGLTVDGADISVPRFSWQETHYLPYSLVASHAWVTTMENAIAKCNDPAWRIWSKGELLLLGISGQSRGEQDVAVTFRFASARTKNNFDVGPITGVDKEGHHYLWIEYEPVEDATAKALTNRPKAVHVERVYDYVDFSTLGLPDPWS